MDIQKLVEQHGNSRVNLLSILHDLQNQSEDNCLYMQSIEELSEIMDIPVAEIVSTASFYTMFSLKPRGRHLIRLCISPPCYVMGEENILEAIQEKLGIGLGETTEDKMFTLEGSSCLGACGVAPVCSIDDEFYGNLTREKIHRILDQVAAEEGAVSERN